MATKKRQGETSSEEPRLARVGEMTHAEAARDALTRDPSPVEPLPPSEEDLLPGYHMFAWGGHEAYRCNFCQFDSFSEEDMRNHVTGTHLTVVQTLALRSGGETRDEVGNPVPLPNAVGADLDLPRRE
jgi:hypothetical protein